MYHETLNDTVMNTRSVTAIPGAYYPPIEYSKLILLDTACEPGYTF